MTTNSPPARRGCLYALAGLLVAVVVVASVGWWMWTRHTQALLDAQAARAREEAAPADERLEAAIRANADTPVDVDRTVRVIHEIDLAMRDTKSVRDYLQVLAHQDYRGVAPDVLRARKAMMDVLLRLYAKQVEAEDQEAAWEVTRETMLQAASLVSLGADRVPGASSTHVALDKEQARTLLEQVQERREAREKLRRDIHGLQDEIVTSTADWSSTWYRWIEEWDRLCAVRDRAYLAASQGDWKSAYAAAKQAADAAPTEREAHLLMALALVEGGPQIAPEGPTADEILSAYVAAHPDARAPALLLSGVDKARRGDVAGAKLDLAAAATFYPKQAEALNDLLDPYRARAFLRKSREGTYIVQLYQSTMDGAGYFSPDLQLARLAFQAGDRAAGRAKVLDHFQRRRTQAEWSFILDDLRFAASFLGDDFRAMLPEASFLDLDVKPALLGDSLSLAVRNRSDRTLHNATLLLCLHLTDMHPDDYDVLKAGDTQAAVTAHESTSFGDVPIELDVFGQTKGVKDIVEHRAILIADEAVAWVDTDAYKIAEGEAFRRARRPPDRVAAEAAAALERGAAASWRSSLGSDAFHVTLPRELVGLSPTFRLKIGDEVLAPSRNELDATGIQLDFSLLALKLKNLLSGDGGARPAVELLVSGPGSSFDLRFVPGPDGSYHLDPASAPR